MKKLVSDYRYHPGDKVLVREDLHEATWSMPEDKDKVYRMRSGPQEGGWSSCYSKHLPFAGKVVTIRVCDGCYDIEEDKSLSFVDDMLAGIADKNECTCESLL